MLNAEPFPTGSSNKTCLKDNFIFHTQHIKKYRSALKQFSSSPLFFSFPHFHFSVTLWPNKREWTHEIPTGSNNFLFLLNLLSLFCISFLFGPVKQPPASLIMPWFPSTAQKNSSQPVSSFKGEKNSTLRIWYEIKLLNVIFASFNHCPESWCV